ncbi:hypothetical protein L208DRAFT_1355580 [Tricholoma matsutake]|nr:hypothetical protein L208DRAFT_1355580 [Tricholoma matsutake 945]
MSSGLKLTVDSTLGAASVGFFISSVVFGVLTSQAFTYFRRYPLDKPAYKVLVAALWGLELVDQIFVGYAVYVYVVTNFQNPLFLIVEKIVWPLVTQVGVGALIGCVVRVCFAMRVWRFSNRNIVVTGSLLIIILVSFGKSLEVFLSPITMNVLILLQTFATLALSTGVAADTFTAVALCFYLRRLRTGHKKSDSLVNSLTIYAVNTGALTSLFSTMVMVLYNRFPNAFYFMGTYFVLSQLYALSFFCTLNTRKAHRGKGTDRETSDNSNKRSGSHFVLSHHRRTVNSLSHAKSIEIGVAQDVTVTSDVLTEASISH